MSDLVSLVFNVVPPNDFGLDAVIVAVDSIGIAVVAIIVQTQLTILRNVAEKNPRRSTVANAFLSSSGGFMVSGMLFYSAILLILFMIFFPPGTEVVTFDLKLTQLTVNVTSLPLVFTIIGILLQALLFGRYFATAYIFIPFRALVEPLSVRLR